MIRNSIENKNTRRDVLIKQSDKFIPKNIMIDPSLMDSENLPKIHNYINKHSEEFEFFISESFFQAVQDINRRQILNEFFETEYNLNELNIIFQNLKSIKFFDAREKRFQKRYAKYNNLYDYLTKSENEIIRDILYEEWVFLQEYSWIVSRTKKTFEKFKESGSVALEFSKEAANKLARRTLHKKDDEFLNTFDMLRMVGKWIAVGVVSLAPLYFKPEISVLMEFASNGFLLLDP
jgi:hypothetical protein